MSRLHLATAALLGALGVGLGAFGAHGLEAVTTDPQRLGWWETGSLYHLLHAVILAVAAQRPGRAARVAGVLFVVGIALFCGTLYAMSLGGPRLLGAITPVGGISLIAGWFGLLVSTIEKTPSPVAS